MPSGVTHRKFSHLITGVSVPISIAMSVGNPGAGLGLLFGVLIGTWITPDLDTHDPIGGWIGGALGFEAYRKNVKHRMGLHRRDWRLKTLDLPYMSHIPFAGTSYRAFLLIRWPLLFLVITGLISQIGIWNGIAFTLTMWLGMSLQDSCHVVLDKTMKEKK